jgi:hypothetical protein
MVAKAIWATILAIGVLAVSGLGFAAFTAQATVNATATAGTLSVVWDNAAVQGDGQVYTLCSASIQGTNLWFNASALAPGDWCMVFGNLSNTGNVGANVELNTVTSTGFSNCFSWDQLSSSSGTISAGGEFPFQATLGVLSTAGNSCEGATGTATTTLSVTTGSV